MESIKNIFRIGHGPSSSHTMGPRKAATKFLADNPNAYRYQVTLYGSLAATGKGHLTGEAIEDVFKDTRMKLLWKPEKELRLHTNGMKFLAFAENNIEIGRWICFSVGGGAIVDEAAPQESTTIYEITNMDNILTYCNDNGCTYWQFVEENEGKEIWDYLENVWSVMVKSIKAGISQDGTLPGGLKLPRRASSYHARSEMMSGYTKAMASLYSYALAVSEENASGGKIVTAPTCGACGLLPAVLYFFKTMRKTKKDKILKALATAGLFGNIVKYNASISGAEAGCQAEVGTACAMAAAAATQLYGGTIYQIEYAAEVGIEHHLGLTCDPVLGLVQIPCIERNVFGAARALDAADFAILSDGKHRISFDEVTNTLIATGKDMNANYRETAMGGLALQDAFPVIY